MKRCNVCKELRPLVAYGKQAQNRDGKKGTCKRCDQKRVATRTKTAKRKLKAGGCIICGYSKCLEALDFHHTEDNKSSNISKINSVAKAKEEAKKCIVVCANCHREIHAGMVNEYPVVTKLKSVREINIKIDEHGQMKIWD